jgi:hypothetical protein
MLTLPLTIAAVGTKMTWKGVNRIEKNLDVLNRALETGSIFNVDYEEAKHYFNRALELALDGPASAFWAAQKRDIGDPLPDGLFDACNRYVSCHQIPSQLRRVAEFEDRYDLSTYKAILLEMAPVAEALKQLKGSIVKGRKPVENPVAVDLSNTGHCAICGGLHKLAANFTVVHHGFTISNARGYLGFRNGRCYGYQYLPYELSCDANKDFATMLEAKKRGTESAIKRLRSGKVTELSEVQHKRLGAGRYEDVRVTYTLGQPEFDTLLKKSLANEEGDLANTITNIRYNDEKIAAWVLKPLPHGIKGSVA